MNVEMCYLDDEACSMSLLFALDLVLAKLKLMYGDVELNGRCRNRFNSN